MLAAMLSEAREVETTEMVESTESVSVDNLDAVVAGDAVACEAFVREHAPRMLAVTRRFFRCESDSADALQDAFVSAFRALHAFEGGSSISTWLHRITVNACLMKLRSRKRRPEQSIEDLLPTYYADGHRRNPQPAWEMSADEDLEKRELRQFVRAAIDEMPDEYRTVLLLRDIEELDTETTAKMLETTEGAVKTRLHRARQALRTLLERKFSETSRQVA